MSNSLYEADFYRWAHQQSDLLLQGQFDRLDLSRLIVELTDLGNCHYEQLGSRLLQLVAYLYSSGKCTLAAF